MARFSRRQHSFTNGEVSPRLFMRSDMEFYYASLAECINFLPDHKGNLVRRPPTRFISESKDGVKPCLYSFNVGRDCPVIIEAYPDCFRFIMARARVLDNGVPLEVAHTYGDDYCDLEYTQDCGALFIAHENHPKQILRKRDNTFTLEQIENTPFAEQNSDQNCKILLGAGGGTGDATTGFLRSIVCSVGDIIQLAQSVDPNPIANPPTLIAVTATAYNGNGICEVSFPSGTDAGTYEVFDQTTNTVLSTVTLSIGRACVTASGCSPFTDTMVGKQIRVLDEDGVGTGDDKNEPNTWINATVTEFTSATKVFVDYDGAELKETDLFRLPAYSDGVFPETAWIHQDRLFCATENSIVASKTGDFFNYDPSDPDGTVNPDNAIYRRINSGQCGDIRWLWPMGRHLIVGTSDGLYSLLGSGTNGAFSADAVAEQRNQNIGVADIRPVQIGEAVTFMDRTRTKMYATGFSSQYDHIGVEELTIFADHIGDECIKKMAYQQCPYSVIWGITDAGTLFSLTFVVGQGVKGWARHELGGTLIKDGCSTTPEVCDVEQAYGPNEKLDDIYFVVKRTINGSDRYYIEVLEDYCDTNDHHFEHGHLDCHLPLLNISSDDLPVVGDGPAAFSVPPSQQGDFSVSDGECWYKYTKVGDTAVPVAPNTYDTPIAGRDWTNAGTDDDCEWVKIPKLKYCDEPVFVSEAEHVFRQPCGIERVATCVSSLAGLEHLAGEDILVFADGNMFEETVSATGTVDRGGCIVRAGFPYDSRFKLLPYRQNLGSTDGAADPSRIFEVNINVMKSVWVEIGTGEHDEHSQQNAKWKRVNFDVEGIGAPEPFTGWINATHYMDFSDNNDSGLFVQVKGPWPSIIRSIETIIEASGGR